MQSRTHGPAKGPSALPRQLILEEVDRILGSSEFSRSPKLSCFFRFAVEQTLDGRREALKEYVIGVEVYGRGDSFDPRVDPIVRVQASKLRARLAAYYANASSASPLQIEFPKGAYVPVFLDGRHSQEADRRNLWRPRVLAAIAPVTIATLLLFWRFALPRSSPELLTPGHLTLDTGWTGHPAVSRDGSMLAFASDRPDGANVDIWIQNPNGEGARRLTTHPAIDWTPDFSPDGRRIIFRSFRDGGGIYSIPVAGGPETLLAPGGFEARFSPDGRWIAYSAVGPSANSSIYVVPAEGGAPRRVQAQNFSAGCPVWTPDGKGLLFRMSETDTKHDWWLAPFDPAETAPMSPRRIGFHEAVIKVAGNGADNWSCPGDWVGREMFFVVTNGALYRMRFSSTAWRALPEGGLVLQSPGWGYQREYMRALQQSSGRRSLVFSQGPLVSNFWAVPLNLSSTAGEEPKQLTHDASLEPASGLTLSRDGQFLAFPSYSRGPGRRIVLRNLRTGTDRPVSPRDRDASKPIMTLDGSRLAWLLVERGGKQAIFTAGSEGEEAQEICADCGVPKAWSPDGSIILYTGAKGSTLWSLELSSGQRKCLFKRPGYELQGVGFSPDGLWLALVIGIAGKPKLQGVLAPFDHLADEQRWISIVEEDYHLPLEWAAEGDLVYYLSRRDDFRCLYGQRLRASDKRPIGSPLEIRHFHGYQNYPDGGSPIAVARDKVVLRLSSKQANIWRLDLPDGSR